MPIDMSEFESEGRFECKIAQLKEKLSPEQNDKLEHAFDRGYTTYAIRKVLNKWGSRIAAQTIEKHRKGQCSCVNGEGVLAQ